MKFRRFTQFILLLAIMAGSLLTTRAAFAASLCGTGYTVISGDTLKKIAAKCDTTIYALRRANPSIGSGDLIYAGQVLILPGAIIYNSDTSTTYVIARGDTLKSIATSFATTVDTLVKLNPEITNINLIYEGQRILVSGFGSGATPPASSGTYTVQRGDTLKKIADRFGTTTDAILKVNAQITNPNLIYVGQVINLPASITSYVVQKGDTLKIIANRFGTTVDNLLALNPSITNPNLIYVGQVIRIR